MNAKTASAPVLDTEPQAKPAVDAADLLAASEGNVTPIAPDVEVKPAAKTARAALAEVGERNRSARSAGRKANGTATTKADPKPAPKAKVAAKPKTAVERVPAAEVIALLDEFGLTRSQLATAVGKSNSLVSEWVGKGRGHLVARSEWKAIEAAARKAAQGVK